MESRTSSSQTSISTAFGRPCRRVHSAPCCTCAKLGAQLPGCGLGLRTSETTFVSSSNRTNNPFASVRFRPRAGTDRTWAPPPNNTSIAEHVAPPSQRRHSSIHPSTATSTPRLVTIGGPQANIVSSNSLKRACASRTAHFVIASPLAGYTTSQFYSFLDPGNSSSVATITKLSK